MQTLEYGLVEATLELIEYFRGIGEAEARELVYKPHECVIHAYAEDVLVEINERGDVDRLLKVVFEK